MKFALGCLASLGVGIVAVVLMVSSDYSWWESILVGVFCSLPVFLLGAWWAERRLIYTD